MRINYSFVAIILLQYLQLLPRVDGLQTLIMKYASSKQNRISPFAVSYGQTVGLSINTIDTTLNTIQTNPSIVFKSNDSSFISPGLTLERSIADAGDKVYEVIANVAEMLVTPLQANETTRNFPVISALQKLQKDMDFLDEVAARTPQLTKLEFAVLFSSVCFSAFSPVFLSTKIVEVVVPSMAALAASVGISAEYVGKVAMSNGKPFNDTMAVAAFNID